MIDLPAIVIANVLGTALMVLLLISNRMNSRTVFFDEKLFCVMAALTIFLCLCEMTTFCINGQQFQGARVLAVVLNTLLFVGSSLFPPLWVAYVDYKLFEDVAGLKRRARIWGIPGAISLLLSLMNLFWGVYFTISADNIYARTPWNWISYAITYGYLIYGAARVMTARKKVRRYLFLPVLLFLAPVFLGSLLQLIFYGLSLIWVSVALGLMALYINIQNEASSVDALTGLYNRRYLNRYLNDVGFARKQSGMLAGIMLDVDNFKAINDTFGHSVGDAALRDVGVLLHSAIGDEDFAARYAGDEFVVLRWVDSIQEIHDLMDTIRRCVPEPDQGSARPYRISFSMGYSIFRPGEDSVDSFLRRMDARMYQEKRQKAAQR